MIAKVEKPNRLEQLLSRVTLVQGSWDMMKVPTYDVLEGKDMME